VPTRSEISDQVWKKLKEPLLRNDLTISQLDPAKLLAALEEVEGRNDRLSTEVGNALLEASLALGESLKETSEHSIVNVMHKMRTRAEEAEGRLQQINTAWVLFYGSLPDGEYVGLGAMRAAMRIPGADAERCGVDVATDAKTGKPDYCPLPKGHEGSHVLDLTGADAEVRERKSSAGVSPVWGSNHRTLDPDRDRPQERGISAEQYQAVMGERQRLREALRKALTCGLDSSVREIVVAALRGASPELS
jgi:hypothetical protein